MQLKGDLMDKQRIKHIIKFTNIDFVLDIINNQFIYLSSPLNFNDPLDSYFVTLIGRRPNLETKAFLGEYLEMSKKIFVFCGTNEDNIDNVLMWSHYGDCHKGVALKYKVPENLLGNLDYVSYEKHTHKDFMSATGNGNPFKVPSKDKSERRKLIDKSIFLKDNGWQYESEVRYTREFKSDERTIEKGWEVESVYLGSEYLDNNNEHLEEILKIVDSCEKNNIQIFRMEYSFCKEQEKYRLKNQGWIQNEHMLERENYCIIRRSVVAELKNRLKNSTSGEVLTELIKEVAEEVVNKKWDSELRKSLIQFQF